MILHRVFTRYGMTISFKKTKTHCFGLPDLAKEASLFSVADTPIEKVSVFTQVQSWTKVVETHENHQTFPFVNSPLSPRERSPPHVSPFFNVGNKHSRSVSQHCLGRGEG